MDIEEDKEFYPIMESVKTHGVRAKIIPFKTKRKGFGDLIGYLPHKSICGNFYVMLVYEFDSNMILAEPIKNRQAETICDEFIKMHKILKSRGRDPKVYIMDN